MESDAVLFVVLEWREYPPACVGQAIMYLFTILENAVGPVRDGLVCGIDASPESQLWWANPEHVHPAGRQPRLSPLPWDEEGPGYIGITEGVRLAIGLFLRAAHFRNQVLVDLLEVFGPPVEVREVSPIEVNRLGDALQGVPGAHL